MTIRNNIKNQHRILTFRRDYLIKKIKDEIKSVNYSTNIHVGDIADSATNIMNEDFTIIIAREEENELRQIEEALGRIEKGQHEICENCGSHIAPKRLKAIPYATLCKDCKELEEKETFSFN